MQLITINKENRYFLEFVNLTYHWGKRFDTYEIFKKKYQDSIDDKLPKIRALIINDTVIGFYEINEKDGIDDEEYTPYLANVYVKEEYRKRGYSTILINDSIKYAKQLGYEDLYLHSKQKNYYEKYGFEFIGIIKTKHGEKRLFKHKK